MGSGCLRLLHWVLAVLYGLAPTLNKSAQAISPSNNNITTAGHPINDTNSVNLINNNILLNDSPRLDGYMEKPNVGQDKFGKNDRIGSATSQLQKLNNMRFYKLVRKMSKKDFDLNELENVDEKQFTKDLLARVIKNPYNMSHKQLEKTFIYVIKRGKIDLDQPNSNGFTIWDYINDYAPWLIKSSDNQKENKQKKRALKMKNP